MFLFEVILRFDFWIAFSKDILKAIDNLHDLSSIELGADPNNETECVNGNETPTVKN
jgi:hypothetical protein